MKFAIGGCATTVFALLAIAAAPLAWASPDSEFLDALSNGGLSFPPQATPHVINGGHAVCQDFAHGASYADVVTGIAGPLGGNQRLAGTFVRAAASSLCPKYMSQLP
jgi:Protein of unknown function (DUF732)